MSEMSMRSERSENRLAPRLWGAAGDDAVYLRRLASEMRAYEERRKPAGLLRATATEISTIRIDLE